MAVWTRFGTCRGELRFTLAVVAGRSRYAHGRGGTCGQTPGHCPQRFNTRDAAGGVKSKAGRDRTGPPPNASRYSMCTRRTRYAKRADPAAVGPLGCGRADRDHVDRPRAELEARDAQVTESEQADATRPTCPFRASSGKPLVNARVASRGRLSARLAGLRCEFRLAGVRQRYWCSGGEAAQ